MGGLYCTLLLFHSKRLNDKRLPSEKWKDLLEQRSRLVEKASVFRGLTDQTYNAGVLKRQFGGWGCWGLSGGKDSPLPNSRLYPFAFRSFMPTPIISLLEERVWLKGRRFSYLKLHRTVLPRRTVML